MNNPLPDLMELIQSSCSALLLPCKYKARGFSLSRYTICEESVSSEIMLSGPLNSLWLQLTELSLQKIDTVEISQN